MLSLKLPPKIVFAILFVSVFASMLGIGIVAPILPIYAERNLAASGIWIGLIFSGYGLSRIIASPIVGRVSDIRGRKKFLIIGLLGYALTGLGYVFANNVTLLTIIRFANGFTSAMVLPVSQAYIGDLTPKGKEGTYMNTFMISLSIGFGAGPFIGGWMYDRYSAAAAFYTMAALSAIALVTVILFLPSPESLKGSNQEQNRAKKTIKPSIREAFRDKYVKGIMTYRASIGLARSALVSFLPIFLTSTFAASATQTGIVLAILLLIGALFQYPMGILSDRVNKTRLTLIGMGGAAACLFIMPFSPTLEIMALIVLIGGFFFVTADAPALAIGAEAGRKYGIATVLSLYDTSVGIGMVGGPIISGFFVNNFGISSIFYLWSVIIIIALIICYIDLREKRVPKHLEKIEKERMIEKRTNLP
ncbi:MAG: MFS transporter [Candidatus Jordarchaeaceae archaeon]